MATAEITSPDGQRVWSWSAGLLDDHEFEPQSEEQIEEGLLRAAEAALATADVEPGDVLTLRIGPKEVRRTAVVTPEGGLEFAEERPMAANPYKSCPSCGAGAKDSAESCWRCKWEFAPKDKPTFGRVARGRVGMAANPGEATNPREALDFEGDPAGTRERFRRLAEKRIARSRAEGLEPLADPEDAAQAAMLGELAARRRGARASKFAAYSALDDEVARSASVAETPLRVVREVLEAIKAKRDRDAGSSAARPAATFRRSRLKSSLPAPSRGRLERDPFLIERLERALEGALTFREREIVKLRHGIGDGQVYTLEEVAAIFRVTRERVRQIEAVALQKLARAMGPQGR